MKKKIVDPAVTQSMLDKQTEVLLEKFQEYRNEVLNRMDKGVANYGQVKEEQVFIKHDIVDLQERVGKLEQSTKTA